jgi:GNAT superfamily N-acetyltransferase
MHMDDADVVVRAIQTRDASWVRDVVTKHFGSTRIVSRGRLHHSGDLPGLVAEVDSAPVGLLLYRTDEDAIEIVVLVSEVRRQGIARQLVSAMRERAASEGCRRLWLITTNDNLDAIAFYQTTGWVKTAVHKGAVRQARRLKPEIPEVGPSGIRIEDEIEFAFEL